MFSRSVVEPSQTNLIEDATLIQMLFEIDPVANLVTSASARARGTHRYEALFLSMLVSRDGTPLAWDELNAAISLAGQARGLDRTGRRRILESLVAIIERLLGAGAGSDRLKHSPRKRTVGPWWWIAAPNETWLVSTGFIQDSEQTGPDTERSSPAIARLGNKRLSDSGRAGDAGIAESDCRATSLTCLELILKSDALARSGALNESQDLLAQITAMTGVRPEMHATVMLRRIRILRQLARYDDATDLWQSLSVLSRTRDVRRRDPGIEWLAKASALKGEYDQQPSKHRQIADQLSGLLLPSTPDVRGACHQHNFAALLCRREALDLMRLGPSNLTQPLLNQAWRHISTAIYWATTLRDQENLQNFVFNAGLILKTQFDAGDVSAFGYAVQSFRLAIRCCDEFLVGNDSVWEYIVLGELWLDHPTYRKALEGDMAFGGSGPQALAFYDEAMKRAKEIGEPRQLARCAANLFRYALQCMEGLEGERSRRLAVANLRDLVAKDRTVLDTLRLDGVLIVEEMLAR